MNIQKLESHSVDAFERELQAVIAMRRVKSLRDLDYDLTQEDEAIAARAYLRRWDHRELERMVNAERVEFSLAVQAMHFGRSVVDEVAESVACQCGDSVSVKALQL